MTSISKSVVKKDHATKIRGEASYVDDLKLEGMLHGKFLRSAKPCAKIKKITLPSLPEGYFIVDKQDVPGINRVAIVENDTPIFAEDRVEYVSEPILMVVGSEKRILEHILSEIQVVYEEEPPILDMKESTIAFFDYHYEKGEPKAAFAKADQVIEEEFFTGYQEQAYLEPQGMIGLYQEGKTSVYGSIQCPYYVHSAVKQAMGCEAEQVQIVQTVTGGGFGGKEDYPSVLACQVAIAAKKAKAPVKVVLDRREDISTTSKRHPAFIVYKTAIKDGKITAMDVDVRFNSGAYTTLSPVVLQRGIIAASGVYNIEHLSVHGRAMKTNTVPNGAFRGFGAPQVFFAVEMHMAHIAKKLSLEPVAFKESYFTKQGYRTSTSGLYHFHVPLPEMMEKLEKISDFRAKRASYASQSGRYRKGMGVSTFFHGCGFTGSGERDFIKAVAKLVKYEDDTIEILISNTDIGQGLKTTFCKIAADILQIPMEQIKIENPDTDRVPDSGPTVASRSLMTVGRLIERAAKRLRESFKPGQFQCFEEHYKQPDFMIPFDISTFCGDAYPTFSWGVNAIEVQIDTLTGVSEVTDAFGVFDVGVPIDNNIIKGQMEGGFLQGIGYGAMEYMDATNGFIRNNSFSDYIIPTAVDVPHMQVATIHNPYIDGPFGAKGAGELPLDGAAPAYVEAVEQALGCELNKTPFMPEDILKAWNGRKNRKEEEL